MKPRLKILAIVSLLAVGILLLLSQLQPVVLRASRAIDGTFGVRPQSHRCLGFTVSDQAVPAMFPNGDFSFRFFQFSFRYRLWEEDRQNERPICFGQDIWFGE